MAVADASFLRKQVAGGCPSLRVASQFSSVIPPELICGRRITGDLPLPRDVPSELNAYPTESLAGIDPGAGQDIQAKINLKLCTQEIGVASALFFKPSTSPG